jgi:hypothetical protein
MPLVSPSHARRSSFNRSIILERIAPATWIFRAFSPWFELVARVHVIASTLI